MSKLIKLNGQSYLKPH